MSATQPIQKDGKGDRLGQLKDLLAQNLSKLIAGFRTLSRETQPTALETHHGNGARPNEESETTVGETPCSATEASPRPEVPVELVGPGPEPVAAARCASEPEPGPQRDHAGPAPLPVSETEEDRPRPPAESDELDAVTQSQSDTSSRHVVALVMEAIDTMLDMKSERVADIFEKRWALDRFKEAQIDRLHQELTEHKQNLLAKTSRPYINGIIRMHDTLGKIRSDWVARPETEVTVAQWTTLLEELQDDLEILLQHQGVCLFREPEPKFNPHRQTSRRTTPTTDSELVGKISSVYPGYEQDGMLIQKERVDVWVAAKTEA
ncbi:hypothetical protein SCOR_07130 [Sulfidibacter corallicola]|uniref:Nucleotide exchange factor GrpE n=1 Tax=Sulfidibacter corallicola TaxID=2818388 RepID=A0A8A4TR53_SULCO|nr:hypothetical protein [Sulfidibacter corallicola]QTD51461.1 hypothetical protein J3U87_03240 [Sulfidibacter corallicola]